MFFHSSYRYHSSDKDVSNSVCEACKKNVRRVKRHFCVVVLSHSGHSGKDRNWDESQLDLFSSDGLQLIKLPTSCRSSCSSAPDCGVYTSLSEAEHSNKQDKALHGV